jgi:hypothetical protein
VRSGVLRDDLATLRERRVTALVLQTRFNGDCDDGCLPESFVDLGPAFFAVSGVLPGGTDSDEQFVDSLSCPSPWAKTGKMWAPPGVIHAWILDAWIAIMTCA